jgi:hypothetical protein
MAFAHTIDWGTLSCIPLWASRNPSEDLSLNVSGWTTSGETHAASRIAILENALISGISLDTLARELHVKWSNFDEWAATKGQNTISIFLDHIPWKDELLHTENNELRDRLEVTKRNPAV